MTTDDGGSDTQIGGPPPVLLAALGAALLIAVGLVFAFSSLTGGGGDEPTSERTSATTPKGDDRVLLTVSVIGSGIGNVRLSPSGVSCNSSCEYKFTPNTRVTATVRPENGSTFEEWGDACSGTGRCSFVMDRPRIVSATFAPKPVTEPLCDGVAPEDRDPGCPEDAPGSPAEPVVPGPDCEDAIDNDDDGLTDTEQDPDCETSGTEGGTTSEPPITTTPSTTPPPPSSVAPNECTDGRDNDDDGLTDRAQDPDCEKGRSEGA